MRMFNKILDRIKFEITINFEYIFAEIIFRLNKDTYQKVSVLSDNEVIKKIIEEKISISRFGDGEIKWIMQVPQQSFEKESKELSERLEMVLRSKNDKILVCIPDVFDNLNKYRYSSRRFWRVYMGKYRSIWFDYIDSGQKYGNSLLTRPYMSYKDKGNSVQKFKNIKKIWNQRNIIIIEGEKTFFGVNNDLLDNVNSIKRIICPATNSFSKYDAILNKTCLHANKEDLILIALGPTATVLAYDLSNLGYQALDLGHIDIEYEWFLKRARNKQVVPGKYVNETGKKWIEKSGFLVSDSYYSTIIDEVIN